MAKAISTSTQAALEAGTLVTRDFMRITARVRATGKPVTEGFWSDIGEITAPVRDAESGLVVSYPFQGVGALIAIDPIPMVSNLTIHEVEVRFSQLEDRIDALLRVYDMRQARVEIYRGAFDPATMAMVAPAEPRFVGFVDGAPVETPGEGEQGHISIQCVSSAQELTRGNPDVRSHESQRLRDPKDDFFRDVTKAGDLVIFWGSAGRLRSAGSGKKKKK